MHRYEYWKSWLEDKGLSQLSHSENTEMSEFCQLMFWIDYNVRGWWQEQLDQDASKNPMHIIVHCSLTFTTLGQNQQGINWYVFQKKKTTIFWEKNKKNISKCRLLMFQLLKLLKHILQFFFNNSLG